MIYLLTCRERSSHNLVYIIKAFKSFERCSSYRETMLEFVEGFDYCIETVRFDNKK